MNRGVFITGTDTGVGKTFVSAMLLAAAELRYPGRARYFKPIQTGSDDDTTTVLEFTGLPADHVGAPFYRFEAPMAPSRAAALESKSVSLRLLLEEWQKRTQAENHYWIVEGAGGLLVPVNSRQTIRDIVRMFELPLILVASTRLGTINHTLLSLEAARSANLQVAGYILNGPADPGLRETIAEFDPAPCLAEIPHFASASREEVQALAARWLTQDAGSKLFPVSLQDPR